MSIARMVTETRNEAKATITEIALKTGSIYKDADGDLCPNEDTAADAHTYALVTNAVKAGTIRVPLAEAKSLAKDVIDLPV